MLKALLAVAALAVAATPLAADTPLMVIATKVKPVRDCSVMV